MPRISTAPPLTPAAARAFIERARWVFARTMPDWPHEYTVKAWRPDQREPFEAFCLLVRRRGRPEPWPPPPAQPIYHNRYLVIDGLKYWAMGGHGDAGPVTGLTVINRAAVDPGRPVAPTPPCDAGSQP